MILAFSKRNEDKNGLAGCSIFYASLTEGKPTFSKSVEIGTNPCPIFKKALVYKFYP
jgi:hypothetical protein